MFGETIRRPLPSQCQAAGELTFRCDRRLARADLTSQAGWRVDERRRRLSLRSCGAGPRRPSRGWHADRGSAARRSNVVAAGRNRRVQMGSAIRHAETDALENAGDCRRAPTPASRCTRRFRRATCVRARCCSMESPASSSEKTAPSWARRTSSASTGSGEHQIRRDRSRRRSHPAMPPAISPSRWPCPDVADAVRSRGDRVREGLPPGLRRRRADPSRSAAKTARAGPGPRGCQRRVSPLAVTITALSQQDRRERRGMTGGTWSTDPPDDRRVATATAVPHQTLTQRSQRGNGR